MFTSMQLDEELFNKAWSLSGERTKKGVVEKALRVFIRLHEQAQVRRLRGALVWEGDLQEQRKGRRRAGSR